MNRTSLGKVLGECLLPYGNEFMCLPDNLYIIGTMNTAGRSLALVEFALRRRFALKRLKPELGERFTACLTQRGVPADFSAWLAAALSRVNAKTEHDRALGPGFLLGHSYYSEGPQAGETAEAWHERVLKDEVVRQLEEY